MIKGYGKGYDYMITLRTLATAFIINDNRILLMERDKKRKFAPGLWAAVGGHLEQNELNNPKVACLREIEEETGLLESDLYNLELKYIVMRKSEDEIRIQYVYFCSTDKIQLKETDEGKLYWINKVDLFNRKLSFTTKSTLEHYLDNFEKSNKIVVGVVDACDGNPIINWSFIEDWNSKSFI